MRFYVATSHRPVADLLELTRLADELGFDGLAMPDHVFVPAAPVGGYPYSENGRPPFDATTLWTDEWIAAAAVLATTRLRFATCVYVLPLRHPLVVARTLATLDALAPGRVELGVGVGWMREEFETLGVDYARRGALTDESIELMRKLWRGGLVEHDGPLYPVPPLHFEPHPERLVPILVGGTSRRALERAARLGDGWVAMPAPTGELLETAGRLRELREALGRADAAFSSHTWADPGRSIDDYRRLVEAGFDTFYVPAAGPVAEARPELERFLAEVTERVR
jgi:probable F420-dependent oxidoreductase